MEGTNPLFEQLFYHLDYARSYYVEYDMQEDLEELDKLWGTLDATLAILEMKKGENNETNK